MIVEARKEVATVPSIGGLGSGLDTDSIVSQLMQLERLPQQRISTRRVKALGVGTAWTQLNVAMNALKTAAAKINTRTATDQVLGTSSNTAVLGVNAGPTALAGTYTMRVNQLATAQSLTSDSTFASPTTLVGAGSLVLQKGLTDLGFTAVTAPAGAGEAATGNYVLDITQASAAAKAGGAALTAADMDFSASNAADRTIDVTLNGVTKTVQLGKTAFTAATLQTALQAGLDNATTGFGAGKVTAVVDAATGAVSLSSVAEGASQAISVATTVGATKLKVAATSGAGQSAKVSVNGGLSTTVDPSATPTVTLNGLSLNVGTMGLWVGKADVTVARTTSATATVSDLAAQVNLAKGVAGATLITNGTATTFSLTGTATGAAKPVTAATAGLTGFTGFTATAGKDSIMTLNGTTVTRPTNTVADVVTGVTFTLNKVDLADVTVTLAPDAVGLSSKVGDLVKSLNGVLSAVNSTSKYDAATKRSGPLGGDPAVRGLANDVYAAVNGLVPPGSTTATTLGSLGIVLGKDGTYAVDDAKLQAAFAKDAAGAGNLIAKLGTALTTVATAATDATKGVTVLGKSEAVAEAARLQKNIEAFEPRLERTRSRYARQFAQLDTALGSLRNQGSFLGGQLANLNR